MERHMTTDDPSAEARTRALDERTPRRRRARGRAPEPLWRESPGGYDPDFDDPDDDDRERDDRDPGQEDRSAITGHLPGSDDLDELPPSRIATSALDAPMPDRAVASPLGG